MKTWTEKAEQRKQEIDNLEQFKTIVKSKIDDIKNHSLYKVLPSWIKEKIEEIIEFETTNYMFKK